jgi:Secretion system C-terminal sorting domain
MRKIFSSLSLAVLTISVVSAQSYISLSADTSFATGDPSEIHKAEVVVSNTGPDDQSMTWKRVKNEIPTEWETSVCDPNLCWAPFADAPGYGWSHDAGEDVNFYVQFDGRNMPDGPAVEGEGVVDIIIYSEDDSANYNAYGVFIGNLGGASFFSPNMEQVYEVYPNPAIHEINLMASYSAGVQQIQVVNLVGKVVLSRSWNAGSGKMTLDISSLPEGIYFVQFLGSDQVLKTKKISVSR